jgi:FixJ family two-component response regulator
MLANSGGSQPQGPLVMVTDDEPAMREALCDLLESVGLRALPFGSASEMLASPQLKAANCLVLDIRLPGMSGLELQLQLARAGVTAPVIFVTGHGDIPMSVKAMKAGAVDFLTKPFRDQDLLDAVLAAIADDCDRRRSADRSAQLQARFAQLTAREREVMALVTQGLMNKQVAARLSLSEITIKIHRRSAMLKMGARTLADLVRDASALGLHAPAAHRTDRLVDRHERPDRALRQDRLDVLLASARPFGK